MNIVDMQSKLSSSKLLKKNQCLYLWCKLSEYYLMCILCLCLIHGVIVFSFFVCFCLFDAVIYYQRIYCQHIQSQHFVSFYCHLLTIYCKYEQFLYKLLSKKTNISKMTSDLLGSIELFQSNQTRSVGTKCVGTQCVGTKQLRPL